MLLGVVAAGLVVGCAGRRIDYEPKPPKRGVQRGEASWYGAKFHGRRTANGEVYDMHEISAAHRTLPFETQVRVENLANGRSLVVRINDRGPFVDGRILDLSFAAAQKLDMVEAGVVPIRLTVVRSGTDRPQYVEADLYRVQIGAFRERTNATQLAKELRPRYKQVEVRSDSRWHRVQIRRISDRRQAQTITDDLLAGGYDAFLSACAADRCP